MMDNERKLDPEEMRRLAEAIGRMGDAARDTPAALLKFLDTYAALLAVRPI